MIGGGDGRSRHVVVDLSRTNVRRRDATQTPPAQQSIETFCPFEDLLTLENEKMLFVDFVFDEGRGWGGKNDDPLSAGEDRTRYFMVIIRFGRLNIAPE